MSTEEKIILFEYEMYSEKEYKPMTYAEFVTKKLIEAKEEISKLRQGDVIGSYAIVRWYDNKDEDVVCTTREVAEDYVKKYNALCGKEKCFVDSEIWLPLREA